MKLLRPYVIRAYHEWISDSAWTTYLRVDTQHAGVCLPDILRRDRFVVLDISTRAVKDLKILNSQTSFSARFGGVVCEVLVPMRAIRAIYAKENGKGVVFHEEEEGEDEPPPPPRPVPGQRGKGKTGHLKLVQ